MDKLKGAHFFRLFFYKDLYCPNDMLLYTNACNKFNMTKRITTQI